MWMHIHEAAKLLGTTPRAIRFYEQKGLLSPVKSPDNGYRKYGEEDIVRLRWIVALRDLGLPIAAITSVLKHSTASADASAGAAEIETGKQLMQKLDEARQALYRDWSRLSIALHALDDVLRDGFASGSLELDALEPAAARVRDAELLRDSWSDRLNYDGLAARYQADAVLEALSPYIGAREYEQAHTAAIQWLEPASGERGIDLGAGTGVLAAKLNLLGASMTAVEQSAEMLALLRSQYPELEGKQGNLLALPLQRASYHFVASTFALQSLRNEEQLLALDEMDRILLPGGRICLVGLTEATDIEHPESVCQRLSQHLDQLGYETYLSLIDSSAAAWLLFAKQRVG